MHFLFGHIVLSRVGIAMHFILIKMSRNLVLLINNPSKKGDMETLFVILGFPIIPSKSET